MCCFKSLSYYVSESPGNSQHRSTLGPLRAGQGAKFSDSRGIGQQSPSKTSSISQDHTGLSASPDKDPPSNFLLGRMHKTCSWDLQVGSWGSEDKDAETCDF